MSMSDELRDSALEYHRLPTPGKISVTPTKPLGNQRDLALAYSPGVAAACEEIVRDPETVSEMTARGNLVAVVTNGTAVLGLGNIGPLAAKPVMEGKGVLFKKFAGIDVFDMEIAENDADKLVDIIASMEPTFGAINLEDIKAPECFEVERKLKERMSIPVMHDDQHGTAIVVGAAMVNALRIVGKDIGKVRLVASGAGAAALACLNLLVSLGVKRENIWVTDIKGVVYKGRNELMDPYKEIFAQETDSRTLDDVIGGADIFLGLSAPRVLTGDMVAKMADQPIVFALANPTPEILPDEVKAARKDAIIATGRSDYPNQVNNVLVFPYIFRGALDVGATQINEEMKLAATYALAELAMAESDERVRAAYGEQRLSFGPEYLIPKPFDSRLILKLAPAVARAAMSSGVARRPIIDFQAYLERLSQWVFRSGLVMKPVFDRAKQDVRRVVYCEGEGRRVLLAVQAVVDEGVAFPILIGRRDVVVKRIKDLDLRLTIDEDFELCDPQDDPRYNDYWRNYHTLLERKGVSPDYARTVVRTRNTVIGTLMVRRREADSMICGTIGRYDKHLEHIVDVIGVRETVSMPAAMNLLIMPQGTFFICDTYVTADPTPEQIVANTLLAAEEVRRFGIEPKVGFLSHSNFGARDTASAQKMRAAIALLHERAPYLEAEGEMHADAALEEGIRSRIFPNSRLKGQANLLIMPNLDAANISFNLLKVLGEGLSVGPILMGAALPAHILTPSATVRNIVNMTALAAVDAQMAAHQRG
ncbi:MAG: malate dehydrogenase [Rhodospirillaceae bacterium]|nr:MAG: malate dehydrogenase [Rhodospirillaceae bacterium]TNC94511.1 MAG: malate dehydrogenase (oxaloacetate-decarboxylating)(NADP+) [Stygiobacter sp.]